MKHWLMKQNDLFRDHDQYQDECHVIREVYIPSAEKLHYHSLRMGWFCILGLMLLSLPLAAEIVQYDFPVFLFGVICFYNVSGYFIVLQLFRECYNTMNRICDDVEIMADALEIQKQWEEEDIID